MKPQREFRAFAIGREPNDAPDDVYQSPVFKSRKKAIAWAIAKLATLREPDSYEIEQRFCKVIREFPRMVTEEWRQVDGGVYQPQSSNESQDVNG